MVSPASQLVNASSHLIK